MTLVGNVDQNHNQIELNCQNGKDCFVKCNFMGLADWKDLCVCLKDYFFKNFRSLELRHKKSKSDEITVVDINFH